MKKIIFNLYGFLIEERDGKLYLQFDAGHFNVKYVEAEITEAESAKAQKSREDASEVMIALEKEKRLRELPPNA